MPNTPKYDIAGDVQRTDALFQIDHLRGELGSSDIEGLLGVDTSQKRLALNAKLASKNLNFKDLAPTLGAQAASVSDAKTTGERGAGAADQKVDKNAKLSPANCCLKFGLHLQKRRPKRMVMHHHGIETV